MPRPADRSRVDVELRKLGFGGLDDPNLVPQIAFCIRDHAQFRSQLFSVLPEQRRLAYEQLRPHLRFAAKPLDVYEAEMKQMAEQNQLPQYDAHTGEIIPFKTGAVDLDLIATEAIRQNNHEKAGRVLILVCSKCTKQEEFKAKLRKDAERDSYQAGWRSDGRKDFCPRCVPTRCTMKLICSVCDGRQEVRCWEPQDGYQAARLRGWAIGDDATCPMCAAKKLVVQ